MKKDQLYLLLAALLFIVAGGYIYLRRRREQPEPDELTTMVKTSYAKNAASAHFKLSEFACKDGTPVPEQYRGNVQALMTNLEVLRAELDGAAIHINSGYRTPSYNTKIGGAGASTHMAGMAADITVSGRSPAQVKAAIERLISAGRMYNGGIGLYGSWVHYDIGGAGRRWNG